MKGNFLPKNFFSELKTVQNSSWECQTRLKIRSHWKQHFELEIVQQEADFLLHHKQFFQPDPQFGTLMTDWVGQKSDSSLKLRTMLMNNATQTVLDRNWQIDRLTELKDGFDDMKWKVALIENLTVELKGN
jgi:hypothetical protein